MAKKSIIEKAINKEKGKIKRKVAKATGIPTTKAGRQKKIGKLLGIK